MIHIIVADQNLQALSALKVMLGEQECLDVVGEATDAQTLLELAATCSATVILVDRQLPGVPLANLIERLHELESNPYVIVMGSQSEYGRSALRAGADAFVSKSDDADWLVESIYNVPTWKRF